MRNKKGIFMKKTSFIILGLMIFSAFVFVPSIVSPTQSKTTAGQYAVELWYATGHYGDTEADVAQMVKDQLEATGFFDVTLKSTDWTTFKAQRNAGTMPFYLMGWWPDYQDESDYLQPFVGDTAFFPGALNNATMTGYINSMTQSNEPTVRATAQKDAQKLLAEQVPLVPLFTMTKQFVAYSKGMTGIVLEPSESLHYASIQKGGSATNTITIGTTDSIPTLDFANGYAYMVSNTLFQTTYGLFQIPVDGTQAVPTVVNGYSISPDGLKYVLNITTELKFTDGSQLTPADVVWSLDRATKLNGEPQGLVSSIDNTTIAAVNSTAITFNLTQKDGILFQKMAYSNSFVYKADNTGNITTSIQGQGYYPVGLGPYKITSWTPDDNIVFAPANTGNEAILGKQVPQNAGVTMKFYTTSSALKTAVESGDVDIAWHTFTSDEASALQSNTNLATQTKDTSGIRYVIINVDTVTQLAVRQAFNYAMDRAEFVSTIFNNTNTELYSMVSPVFGNACKKGDACAYPGKDLTKVASLMGAQGYESAVSSTSSSNVPGFEAFAMLISLSSISILVFKKRKQR